MRRTRTEVLPRATTNVSWNKFRRAAIDRRVETVRVKAESSKASLRDPSGPEPDRRTVRATTRASFGRLARTGERPRSVQSMRGMKRPIQGAHEYPWQGWGEAPSWARFMRTSTPLKTRIGGFVAVVLTILGAGGAPAVAASRIEQRQQYERAKAALDRGDFAEFRRLRARLASYPLHPYLDYRLFLEQLADRTPSQFNAFVERYKSLPFVGTLRSRYLLRLADEGRWKDVLAVQSSSPRDQALRCVYYRAHLAAGNEAEAWLGARELWLTGRSISERCDALLAAWSNAGQRGDALIFERQLLAYAAGRRRIVEALAAEVSKASSARAADVVDLFKNPQNVARYARRRPVSDFSRRLTTLAFKRWARRDVSAAVGRFDAVARQQRLGEPERQQLGDFVASVLMVKEDEQHARWRDRMLKTSKNVRLLERRIRLAIRRARWREVRAWISRLPPLTQRSPRWAFWRGRLAERAGNRAAAREIWRSLTGKADFYSVAAATRLGRAIEYPQRPVPAKPLPVGRHRATLERIAELIELKKLVDAKREWRRLLGDVQDQEETLALAVYASRNNWYHLTVKATISGKLWNHMRLRFPLAFKWWFEFFSKERKVSMSTMLALARLESALDTHAESPARACGLMQILPSTAREVARRIRFRYRGRRTLFDPGVNIRLGSAHLKRMLDRWDGNRILAFASYNAGYRRTKEWTKETGGQLDVYGFIEQIPFNETRGYVQSALMFDVYYARLLGRARPLFDRTEARARY